MRESLRRQLGRALPVALLLALTALVVGLSPAAQADASGTAGAATPVAPLQAAPTAVVPPGSASPWLAPGPSFAGTVVHWTSTAEAHFADIPDPANGQTLHGEFWAQIGDDGAVIREHERFVLDDGSVLQESTYGEHATTMVVAPAFQMSSTPTATCAQRSFPNSDLSTNTNSGPSAASVIPPFAAMPDVLASLGFERIDAALPDLPQTRALPGAQPTQIFAAVGPTQTWERRATSSDGRTTVDRMAVDGSGRVLLGDGALLDATGAVLQQHYVVFGALYVYAPDDVPASVFALITQPDGPCDEGPG